MLHFADIEQDPSGKVINIYVQSVDGTMRSILGTIEAEFVDGYVKTTFVHECPTEGRQTVALEAGWEKGIRDLAVKYGSKVLVGNASFYGGGIPVIKQAQRFGHMPSFKIDRRENNNWRKKGRGFNGYKK